MGPGGHFGKSWRKQDNERWLNTDVAFAGVYKLAYIERKVNDYCITQHRPSIKRGFMLFFYLHETNVTFTLKINVSLTRLSKQIRPSI